MGERLRALLTADGGELTLHPCIGSRARRGHGHVVAARADRVRHLCYVELRGNGGLPLAQPLEWRD